MKVWQDPQHGGSNKGCEWGGLIERHQVVGISNDLVPVLGGMGCEQRLARTGDETIPYADRAKAAADWGAELAFLHHINAMVYPRGHELEGKPWIRYDGLMTFALADDPKALSVAEVIGHCAPVELRQRMPTYVANPHDWTRNAYNCLVHYSRVGIPAVLIEWGFATSPRDRAILQSADHRMSLCAAAACGIGRAYELGL